MQSNKRCLLHSCIVCNISQCASLERCICSVIRMLSFMPHFWSLKFLTHFSFLRSDEWFLVVTVLMSTFEVLSHFRSVVNCIVFNCNSACLLLRVMIGSTFQAFSFTISVRTLCREFSTCYLHFRSPVYCSSLLVEKDTLLHSLDLAFCSCPFSESRWVAFCCKCAGSSHIVS
jgi:hypothetical protein